MKPFTIHAFTLIFALSFLLIPNLVNSQSEEQGQEDKYEPCGTPDSSDEDFESRPWYGNNAILPEYTRMAEEFIAILT
jgi:hypothetical protein